MGTLDILKPDRPARVARCGGWVLLDVRDLMPEVHGDPHDYIDRAIVEAAAASDEIIILARVDNSRPPPEETRKRLFARLEEVEDNLVCASLSLEGTGFRLVAFRSFLAAARLVRVVKAPVVVSGTLEEARARAAEACTGPVPNDALDAFFTPAVPLVVAERTSRPDSEPPTV